MGLASARAVAPTTTTAWRTRTCGAGTRRAPDTRGGVSWPVGRGISPGGNVTERAARRRKTPLLLKHLDQPADNITQFYNRYNREDRRR